MIDGDGLFIKYWYIPSINENFKETNLPGRVKGLSAAKAIEYMTSKKTQKELLMDNLLTSAIPSLYHDPEVCKNKICDIMNTIQLVPRPSNYLRDYDYFAQYYIKYMDEYLFGNKTARETLQEIVDISKIYYITVDSKECLPGFITFIVIIITIFIIICSGVFLASPAKTETKIINNGKNFEVCKFDGKSGMLVISILIAEKIITILGIVFLLFEEWNLIETRKDIRLITSKICVDIILYIIYIIANAININQYITYFIWSSLILITFVITNFYIMFGISIFQIIFNPDKEFNDIKRRLQNNSYTKSGYSSKANTNSKMALSKLVMYHYCTNNPSTNGLRSYYGDRYADRVIGSNIVDKSYSLSSRLSNCSINSTKTPSIN
ncbi:hypothetical protein PIROE2DRAFT_16603 [Piromyces sp. E2]|nr:hypothetical protein PIROE2DRAFT_16603 [Piromyces sp. E2]|eukprot:OUM58194.1 hypothetical protein PIROE2DRAFT_16603 [Piromyces sp. E2]